MKKSILLAAGLALGFASGALALEGAYTSPDGAVTISFGADGSHVVSVPAAGLTINATYTLEGDTLTLVPPAEDATCMGASGTYTVAETDAGATFTVVEDPCTQRSDTMTAGTWAKAAE